MLKKTFIYCTLGLAALSSTSVLAQQDHHMAHDHGSMQGGSAPKDARDPLDYSGDLRYDDKDFKHLDLMDQRVYKALIVDRLERVYAEDVDFTAYELKAWIGKDFNRLVFKSEGAFVESDFSAQSEIYWSHAFADYWNSLLGLRFDNGDDDRQWAAIGIEGLAPYMLDTSIKLFISDKGRLAASLELAYEILFTQNLKLEPKLLAKVFNNNDSTYAEGSGLAETLAALRLKYHFKPELATYIGVEWQNFYGTTKDYAKAAGVSSSDARYMVGVSFWY